MKDLRSRLKKILESPPQRKLDKPEECVDVESRTIYTWTTETDYNRWIDLILQAVRSLICKRCKEKL